MSQDSFSVRIDSPHPVQAVAEAQRYFDFLRPSLEYGGVDADLEVFTEQLGSGDCLLIRGWLGKELLTVTAVKVREVNGKRDLYVIATAGTLFRKWAKQLGEVFDKLAAEADCDTITMQTRAGMDKLCKPFGYRLHQIILVKNRREH